LVLFAGMICFYSAHISCEEGQDYSFYKQRSRRVGFLFFDQHTVPKKAMFQQELYWHFASHSVLPSVWA
jgi:hypothetical protein